MFSVTNQVRIGVGCDPEFFVFDKTLKKVVSAHDLVPGTKTAPYKLLKGAVQADGCAVEYNIDPAYTAKEFVDNNHKVLSQIRDMIPRNYELLYRPSVIFDEEYFKEVPEKPKELGCDPDFSAANGLQNPPPRPSSLMPTMRTGAGHIHVSWTQGKSPFDPSHRWDCQTVVKALAHTYSYIMPLWDKDTRRRNLYGSMYSMRYKSYGVEWRSPSNAWLNHPELWPWLFNGVTAIVKNIHDGNLSQHLISGRSELIWPDYHNVPTSDADTHRKNWAKKISEVVKGFPEIPEIKTDG